MIRRVLALDVGNRRVGVAASDPLGLLARPLVTLGRTDEAGDLAAIVALVVREDACHVVVGLPLLPSGDRGEQAERVEAFMARLGPALETAGVSWSWWDESYTTLAAEDRRRERGARPGRGQASLDAEAAAVILEEWLAEQALVAARTRLDGS